MVFVELDNVAAERRREVCIDMVYGGGAESSRKIDGYRQKQRHRVN